MRKPKQGSLKSIKGKKGKGRKVTRNVLTLNPDGHWWPLISEEKVNEINNVFKEHLAVLHCCNPKVPWHILMKMTGEQRREKIKEVKKSLPLDQVEGIKKANRSRKHVTIGLNMTVRNIEQNKLLFCVVDSTSQPKILIDKLLVLAKHRQLAIGLIPNLKQMLKSIIGFPTTVLGFKKSMMEEQCEIRECLSIRDSLEVSGWKPHSENLTEDIPSTQKTDHHCSTVIKQERLDHIYLMRESHSVRVFNPGTFTTDSLVSNFLSIGSSPEKTNVTKRTFKRYTDKETSKNFESPTVVTTVSNPSKKRKKK